MPSWRRRIQSTTALRRRISVGALAGPATNRAGCGERNPRGFINSQPRKKRSFPQRPTAGLQEQCVGGRPSRAFHRPRAKGREANDGVQPARTPGGPDRHVRRSPSYATSRRCGEDSVSLMPLLEGSDKPVRRSAVRCSVDGVPSVRLEHWKYIAGFDGKVKPGSTRPRVRLYDLSQDIGETNNLAAVLLVTSKCTTPERWFF